MHGNLLLKGKSPIELEVHTRFGEEEKAIPFQFEESYSGPTWLNPENIRYLT